MAGSQPKSLVAGGGGFIGGHLVESLLADGHAVRAVDLKPLGDWNQVHDAAENLTADLSRLDACTEAVAGCDEIFNLAADMGGMGFIENNKALCMLSSLINTHLLLAARDTGARRYFFASSACVYPTPRQASPAALPLREDEAYPAMPEEGYGWEKLFGEQMCSHFLDDFGLETRVARYHNVYGPDGAWAGGREKAPAAICRKVAEAVQSGSGEIEIWGDGAQTRSFTYISDAVEGTKLIARGAGAEPLNVGSGEVVTINELVDLVEDLAGIELKRRYSPDAPQGVRGRNSDNSLILARLGWEPSTSLRAGMATTYAWVSEQVRAAA